MDAGEYETNTLLISNLSAISFRIYEPIASQSSAYTFNASDVEDSLRSDGHLVYMDAVRHGIWCFYLSSGDAAAATQPERLGLHTRMEVCGYPLGLVGDGNLEPIGLLKNRPLGTNAINTPSSSSSTGSALDMNMRGAQPFNFPPTPVVVDGKVASTPAGDVKGYGAVPARDIHEYFITAVLSSLTTYFCRTVGAIVLNHRSALLPPQAFNVGDADWSQTPRNSGLATFRTYLTTTGSLVISLHVAVLQGLVSSADVLRSSLPHAGNTVLAAPFGTFGALQGVVDTENQTADGGFGQSPDTQISRLRPDHSDKFLQWKTTCCKLLQMRGMSPSLLDGCSWLNIHFLQRKPYEQRTDGKRTPLAGSGPTAPWPAVLCFRKPKIESMLDVSLEKALSGSGADQLDPLNKAKMWCRGVSEREDAVARRKKERDAALAREHADADLRSQPQANGYSPMAIWRSSTNSGPPPTNGSMYPTPPDGVQPSGVTPSFDGGPVQSPAGQPTTIAALGDVHPVIIQQEAPAPDSFNVVWDGVEPRPEQTTNNFAEDNLFGDLGEDMFEGNELTDADFNFFDQEPVAGDMDLSGLPDMESSAVGMQDNGNHPFEEPTHAAAPGMETKMDVCPISPQFTKPELRHARSTLAESRHQTNMESFNRNSSIGIKRDASPFNPETVYKRIRASIRPPPLTLSTQRGPPRRRSLFEKVDFDPASSLASKKYEEKGLFDYRSSALKDKENRALQNGGPLTPGGLVGSARQRKNLKELPSDIGSILAKMAGGTVNSPRHRNDARSDSDDSSWASSDEDVSDPVGRASSPAKSSVVRRRPEDDVISMAASFRDLDNMSAGSPSYGPVDFYRLSNSEIPEFSLSRYFADPEPVPIRISVSDEDFITIAQILTEQAASGFLKLAPQRPSSEIQDVRRSLIKAIRYSVRGLQKALPRSLAGAVGCQLRPFAEVQDVPLLVQPNGRVQVRPAEFPKPSVFLIPAPHIEVRRYENQLSVLPSAVSFWDTLGFGPVQGPKSIVAVCLFPQVEGMRDNATAFLDRVQSTYESLRLGAFERLPTVGSIVDGLVLLPTDEDIASPGLNLPRARSAFTDQMANLAMSLAGLSMSEKNFVVYSTYTPENPSSVVESCSAFQELFEFYKRCMMDRKKHVANELVLQLVPLDAVASETSLVILSPSECSRLCLETYDRCTLFGGPMPSPAIMLERALPRAVDFKLSPTPSPNVLRENACIHVAYTRSVDERWVTAAWTDNRGSTQSMASYSLGRRGKPLTRLFADVIHEIWETTHDLISTCKVHWRVIVTKCGPMEQHEIEQWAHMAQGEARANVSLVLLTVDTDPSLQLIPPAATIPLSAPSVFYTTPVGTPQPLSVLSPDQSSNNNPSTPIMTSATIGGGSVTTPGGDNNNNPHHPHHPHNQPDADTSSSSSSDTTLIDTTETTWGIVVSHRLNNSPSLTELNPALASGYLVKRAGPRAEDAPVAIEVNVVYSDNARALYDVLLREMLTYFRGLGTLARARGVVEREVDVRPWHVAVVEKAVRGLYLLM
ncbi:mediator complex subunit 13 C-terminal-domain-containing protein [Chaetomidium leptoderma]|uniref:Mediator of RNA polymerase II transcription subunit 13 n=1 Tax=Chaetomidium leptoderma TaxID=669021 RepID=A0AAN6ZT30_9PEZI|nr:mediator complex subunit 13 C-terminal-domain-containing protein [Chaetomidium leptoderma]